MINSISNINSVTPNTGPVKIGTEKNVEGGSKKTEFSDAFKTMGKYMSNVNDTQQASDVAIKDLLTGKNADITSVVSATAKADMSFKLLVGVRNKLIEAYKQTMNMQV